MITSSFLNLLNLNASSSNNDMIKNLSTEPSLMDKVLNPNKKAIELKQPEEIKEAIESEISSEIKSVTDNASISSSLLDLTFQNLNETLKRSDQKTDIELSKIPSINRMTQTMSTEHIFSDQYWISKKILGTKWQSRKITPNDFSIKQYQGLSLISINLGNNQEAYLSQAGQNIALMLKVGSYLQGIPIETFNSKGEKIMQSVNTTFDLKLLDEKEEQQVERIRNLTLEDLTVENLKYTAQKFSPGLLRKHILQVPAISNMVKNLRIKLVEPQNQKWSDNFSLYSENNMEILRNICGKTRAFETSDCSIYTLDHADIKVPNLSVKEILGIQLFPKGKSTSLVTFESQPGVIYYSLHLSKLEDGIAVFSELPGNKINTEHFEMLDKEGNSFTTKEEKDKKLDKVFKSFSKELK